MLLIPCPFCGPRNEQEFVCAGEVSERPTQAQTLDDAAWGDHLYHRDNPDAPVAERWWHVHGCRAWLTVQRDPHTQQIVSCSAQVSS
jgi:heterotetrameric sarcosine oxidase delta subunit